ncbi:MAG: OmpA family protein [Pseudomonadota bacterium]
MAKRIQHTVLACAISFLALSTALAVPVRAQTATTTLTGERYVPGIWVDPDGCEHWVMDDGTEGYMSPHLDRQGRPVCHEATLCGVVNADLTFRDGSARIGTGAERGLQDFFRARSARAFVVTGHTDNQGADTANLRLSMDRANAVAAIGASVGAQINDVRGYGARQPKYSNDTEAGRAQNRRVDIVCIY